MKTLRMAARLTQEDVAAMLGVKRTAVAMWETGKAKPRADKLPALARLYGCTIDELLSEPEQEISQDDRTA